MAGQQNQIVQKIVVQVQGSESLDALLNKIRQLESSIRDTGSRLGSPLGAADSRVAAAQMGMGGLTGADAGWAAQQGVFTGRNAAGQIIPDDIRRNAALGIAYHRQNQLAAANARLASGALIPRPGQPAGAGAGQPGGIDMASMAQGMAFQAYFGLIFGGYSEWTSAYAQGRPFRSYQMVPAVMGGIGMGIGMLGGPAGMMAGGFAGQVIGMGYSAIMERAQNASIARDQIRMYTDYRGRFDDIIDMLEGIKYIPGAAFGFGGKFAINTLQKYLGAKDLPQYETMANFAEAYGSLGYGSRIYDIKRLVSRIESRYNEENRGSRSKSLATLMSDPRYGVAIINANARGWMTGKPYLAKDEMKKLIRESESELLTMDLIDKLTEFTIIKNRGIVTPNFGFSGGVPTKGSAMTTDIWDVVDRYLVIGKYVRKAQASMRSSPGGVDVTGIGYAAVYEGKPWEQIETLVTSMSGGDKDFERKSLGALGTFRRERAFRDVEYEEGMRPIELGIYAGSKLMGTRSNMRELLYSKYNQLQTQLDWVLNAAQKVQADTPETTRALRLGFMRDADKIRREMIDTQAMLEHGWQQRLISEVLGAPTGYRAKVMDMFNYAGTAQVLDAAGMGNRFFGTWGSAKTIASDIPLPQSGATLAKMQPNNALAVGAEQTNVDVKVYIDGQQLSGVIRQIAVNNPRAGH